MAASSRGFPRRRYPPRPDLVNAAGRGNFAIDGGDIHKIRVEHNGGGFETSGGPDRLIVKTANGKHIFTFGSKSLRAKAAKALLKEVFGDLAR